MPTITPQGRPQVTGQTEDSYRAPVKQIMAASTGMTIDKAEPAAPTTGQVDIIEKTPTQAVTLSPQLSLLARQEAKLRQREQALKTERESLATQKAENEKLFGFKQKLAAKDFSALDELGISYDDIANYQLAKIQGQSPEDQALKKLEVEIQSMKASQEANITKQYDATVARYKADIKDLVAKDPEFVTIKEEGQEEAVLQHILDTFNEDNELLTVEQASKEIEDFLVEDALKKQNLTKVKAKSAPPTPIEEPKKTLPARSGLRTLTNQIAPSTSAQTKYPQFQHLSMKERIAMSVQKAQKKE